MEPFERHSFFLLLFIHVPFHFFSLFSFANAVVRLKDNSCDAPVMLVANKIDCYGDRMVFVEDGQRRYREIGCVGFREISVRESIEQVCTHSYDYDSVCVRECVASLWDIFITCVNCAYHFCLFVIAIHTTCGRCLLCLTCFFLSIVVIAIAFQQTVYWGVFFVVFLTFYTHCRSGVYSMTFVKCGKCFHAAHGWSGQRVKFNRVQKAWLAHQIRQFAQFSIIRCAWRSGVHFSSVIGLNAVPMNLSKAKIPTHSEPVRQPMAHCRLVHVHIIHSV